MRFREEFEYRGQRIALRSTVRGVSVFIDGKKRESAPAGPDGMPPWRDRACRLVDGDHARAAQAAALLSDTKTLDALLSQGMPVDTTSNASGATPLMVAARFGVLDMVRFLCDRGAAVTAADKHGRTALQYAALGDHPEIAFLLCERGADLPDTCYPYPSDLLIWAIRRGYGDLVKAFLERGADPDSRSEAGQTALESAVEGDDEQIVLLLLDHRADADADGD
jgi:ankyrin repeat protein